jgi:antirestriction protein ArdC
MDVLSHERESRGKRRLICISRAFGSAGMVRGSRCAREVRMDSVVLSKAKLDVYRAITEKIIAAMEAGAPEYHMPWHRSQASVGRPINASTKKPYRGVNILSLWADAMFRGFQSGYWATYRQWRLLGAQVRKDSKGTIIVFYKRNEAAPEPREDEKGDETKPAARLIARASWVFNADQVDGWTPPEVPRPNTAEVLGHAETFINRTGAAIQHGGDQCYYSPPLDLIHMVERERFAGTEWSTATESYYAVLLHELVHWSGHGSRLARNLRNRFGDDAYAMEEMVAELGAAFLCADLGITNELRPDHAAYMRSWLFVLKQDRKALFTAASGASTAVEYIASLAAEVGTSRET